MKKPVFEGSSVAIVTPFRSGKVDFDAMEKLIDMQKNAGTAAITVCGTTGESSTMTRDEKIETIRFVKERAGDLPVIAGAGSNSTENAVEKALDAKKAGADAVLCVTPYYNKCTQQGLIAHYTAIAEAVDIPVIVYNVPSRTGITIAPETYEALSKIPNVNGVKEASGDIPLAVRIRRLCGDDLNIWSGNDDIVVPMMSVGAKGVISVAANIVPRIMADLTGRALSGDYEAASELQIKYSRLIELLFSEVNPIPVKCALSLMGLISNELRLPLTPLSGANRDKLTYEMKKTGLI
ncbi:MAG: 4-hydroxy-tetrahydrodipicolinate synthase [Oscillospiraceae bacterium]|nr:4-hydroxy-tetrahydrodipicolinate synthase [Oscillospiraceae bacterium]